MDPSEKLIDSLLATAELCGAVLSKPAAKMLAVDLARYPEPAVLKALQRCRMEITGRLTSAAVIQRIDDGRPGPQEAWAKAAQLGDDRISVLVTSEILEAWGATTAIADDPVAQRMAFLELYQRIVSEARAAGRWPSWTVSLGYDKPMRVEALREAVAQDRISLPEAVARGLPVRIEDAAAVLATPVRELVSAIAKREPPTTCNGNPG